MPVVNSHDRRKGLSNITVSVHTNAISGLQTLGLEASHEFFDDSPCLGGGNRLLRVISMDVYFLILIVVMVAKRP